MFFLHWSVVDGIFIRAWNCIKVEPGVEPFIIESNEIRTSSQAWLLKFCSFSSITLVPFFTTRSFSRLALSHDSLFFVHYMTMCFFSPIKWWDSGDKIRAWNSKNKKFQLFNQLKFQNMHETKKKWTNFPLTRSARTNCN